MGAVAGGQAWGSTTGDNLGGDGGYILMFTGVGGNALNGATNTGGPGGDIMIQANVGGTGATANGANGNIIFYSGTYKSAVEVARFDMASGTVGRFGLGLSSPTAWLHIKASSGAAGTASIKINPGTLMGTEESGAIESDGTHLYWTDSGGTRHQLD